MSVDQSRLPAAVTRSRSVFSDLATLGLPTTRMRTRPPMTSAATALGDSRSFPATAEHAARAAQRGDHAGWDWLFDRFYGLVLRYCAARLGDADQAKDAAQEVFVAAVPAIGRLRDRSESGVEAWLLGIARHKCVDRIRALQRDRGISTTDRGARPPDDLPSGQARRPRPPRAGWRPRSADLTTEDAAEIAVGRVAAADLRAAVECLGEEQREVIIRRFLMDQSLEQVAAATRRPVGAVKSMQHRALAQLAKRCRGAL
jgi:RNA polymerase sigma-70 factor (ECF subfamily)